MAIWDNLIKRIISPVVDESIKELTIKEETENSDSSLLKLLTTNISSSRLVPLTTTKDSEQRVLPRGGDAKILRDFSYYYPILRSCINYRKRQITQLDWDVAPLKVITDKKKKDAMRVEIDAVKEKLKFPVGDKSMNMRTFIYKVLEDLLVLDAIAIYKRRNRGGGIYGYLPIDASTIELVLNPDGTTPVPPNVAYQQKISGTVTDELTTDELIYGMLNARTETPYGLSPVEVLILTVTSALKLSSYNLAFLTEGNVPEGFVELPKDVASNPDQLKLWQEAWDAMFAGDPRYQRKVKFLPEGMKWSPIRKPEDMEFERFEKWLLLNTCSIMEVAPQTIGFQFDRGKGATEAEWEIGKERGLYPTAEFLKEIFDNIIQGDMGKTELQFVWTNINPTNKKEESDVFGQLVKSGAVSVDEWRIAEGFDPIGLGHYIMTPVGPVLVKDFLKMSEEGNNPFIPNYAGSQQGPSEGKPPGTLPGSKPNEAVTPKEEVKPKSNNPIKAIAKRLDSIRKEDIIKELKTWKKAAINDLKAQREFRDFKTDIVDSRTQTLIKEGLKSSKTKDDLDELFKPFISQENQVINAMIDLYEDVSSIIDYEEPETD